MLQHNWFHLDLANRGPEHSSFMSVYNSQALSLFLGSILSNSPLSVSTMMPAFPSLLGMVAPSVLRAHPFGPAVSLLIGGVLPFHKKKIDDH